MARYRCVECGFVGHDGAAGEPGAALDHTTCGPMLRFVGYVVGDEVTLHHAKAHDRKRGTVVKVTPTKIRVEVPWVTERMTTTVTTRHLDDPDVRLARAATTRGAT